VEGRSAGPWTSGPGICCVYGVGMMVNLLYTDEALFFCMQSTCQAAFSQRPAQAEGRSKE